MSELPEVVVSLEIHQILNILPQRYPFVMVDRVTELVSGKYVRGHKCVSYNEHYFPGHFPDRPMVPNVLVLESLAQLGGILAYVTEPFDPVKNFVYFLEFDKAKFRRPIGPGDRMDLYAEITHHKTNIFKFSGEVRVDGTICAEAEILASVVERKP